MVQLHPNPDHAGRGGIKLDNFTLLIVEFDVNFGIDLFTVISSSIDGIRLLIA